jgi:hypothetical protein
MSPFSNDGSASKVVGIYAGDPVPKSFLIISDTPGLAALIGSVLVKVDGSPLRPGPRGNLGAEIYASGGLMDCGVAGLM